MELLALTTGLAFWGKTVIASNVHLPSGKTHCLPIRKIRKSWPWLSWSCREVLYCANDLLWEYKQ
jgi:hypothetical protein